MPRLRDRTTGDLLVLMVAGTICFSVIAAGGGLLILQLVESEGDWSSAAASLTDVINTLIGLLAGFLAGRTDYSTRAAVRESIRREIESEDPGGTYREPPA